MMSCCYAKLAVCKRDRWVTWHQMPFADQSEACDMAYLLQVSQCDPPCQPYANILWGPRVAPDCTHDSLLAGPAP